MCRAYSAPVSRLKYYKLSCLLSRGSASSISKQPHCCHFAASTLADNSIVNNARPMSASQSEGNCAINLQSALLSVFAKLAPFIDTESLGYWFISIADHKVKRSGSWSLKNVGIHAPARSQVVINVIV